MDEGNIPEKESGTLDELTELGHLTTMYICLPLVGHKREESTH